jgi:plasmid stabilization system protein ParE
VSLPVQTTPESDAQIREIDAWWRRNRPLAPDLFLDELAASFAVIGHAPHIGRLYREGARRLACEAWSWPAFARVVGQFA